MIIVYHQNCRDGFAAAWAVRTIFAATAKFVPGNYGALPEGFPFPGEQVVFVDFSLPREQMIEIATAAKRLRVLDHHKTAEAALSDFPQVGETETKIVFDMNRSGAGIAWDHFHDHSFGTCPTCGAHGAAAPQEHHAGCTEVRPWFIDYVEDRDLWRFALPDSKTINAYLGTRKFVFEEWDELLKITPQTAKELGEIAERKTDAYVSEVCKNSYEVPSFLGQVRTVNAPQVDVSEVLAELLKQYPESPFTVGWWVRNDGIYQHGLRSRTGSDVDVSEIAKRHGGGGHKHAAGFTHHQPIAAYGSLA